MKVFYKAKNHNLGFYLGSILVRVLFSIVV